MNPYLKAEFFHRSSKPWVFPLLAFLVPFILRFVPEMLMGSYVVGFDTLAHYVPTTLKWLDQGVGFWNFLAVAPFLYVILSGVVSIGIPIVLSLKMLSPLFLGLLGFAVYFYANKTLSWSPKKSLLVVFFATLYFVALRVSWDMLRSELALIFLFVTLIFLQNRKNPFRNGLVLSLAMLSVVFAHQLIAIIMFFIVLVTLIRLSYNRQIGDVLKLVVCSAPAAFLFFAIVYANSVVFSEFSLSGWLGQSSAGFISLFGFVSYENLVVDTLGFLVFCYLPILPLVLLGFRRFEKGLQLKAWVLCIFVVLSLAFAAVFIGHFPYRWILLLTYPLAFFAVEGFASLRLRGYKLGAGLMLAMLSVCFIFLPNNIAFPYFAIFPSYVPTSMLQNTVSLSDCPATSNVLQWVKTNMDNDTCLLVHRAFCGWAYLTLDGDQLILYNYDTPETMAQKVKENGRQLWLMWWVNGSGWYDQPTVSYDFGKMLYKNGHLAIYEYTGAVSFDIAHSEYQKSLNFSTDFDSISVFKYECL